MKPKTLTAFATVAIAIQLLDPATAGQVVTPAQSRTYVSGGGKDTNPCSATLPCLTLAAAFKVTLAGGEIFVLDSANYGPITINKAISITSEGASAGVLVSNGTAITIAAGATDVVNLRGLDLDGSNAAGNGVQFVSGAALNIQKSSFRGFTNNGLSFSAASSSSLYVADSVFTGNGMAGAFVMTTNSGQVSAVFSRVTATRNGMGVLVAGAGTNTTLTDMVASSNSYGIGASAAALMVRNSTLSNNKVGISADQAARVQVGQSAITSNGIGWNSTNGGQVISYGNNNVNGNANDGTPSATLALQ